MSEPSFIIDYWSRGRRLTATIQANDWHEAEQRLASLKMTGEIVGEHVATIPAGPAEWRVNLSGLLFGALGALIAALLGRLTGLA